MDKVQIVRYALIQIAALIYSVLASGAAVKWAKQMGYVSSDMPSIYHWAIFISDYGFLFFMIVVAWTTVVSYLSSPFTNLEIGEGVLTWSGIIIAFLIAIAGTVIALGGSLALCTTYSLSS